MILAHAAHATDWGPYVMVLVVLVLGAVRIATRK